MVRKMKEVRKIKKLTDGTEDSFITMEEGSEFTAEDNHERANSLKLWENQQKSDFKQWKKTDMKDHLMTYFNNDIVKSEDFWRQ